MDGYVLQLVFLSLFVLLFLVFEGGVIEQVHV